MAADDPQRGSDEDGGIIVRGADGALYFLRDSVLNELRLPRDLAAHAEKLVSEPDRDRKNFRVSEAEVFEQVARVDGKVGATGRGFRANMAAMSTTMCPSFLFEPGGPIETVKD
jgi:hypothetical protein